MGRLSNDLSNGEDRRLGTVLDLKFAKEGFQVHLDGLPREVDHPAHLFVAQSLGEQVEDLEFLVRKIVFLSELFLSVLFREFVLAGPAFDGQVRQIRRGVRLAKEGLAYDLEKILLVGVLEDITARPGP